MKNKNYLWILIAALLLNFSCINISKAFANTDIDDSSYASANKGIFPDYATDFAGIDKWENFNRKMFIFNIKANKYVIKPINIVWASVMPQYGIDRIHCFYYNMNYPVRLVGSLLQKDYPSSKTETKRFFINLTAGIGGLYDTALTKYHIPQRNEDVEQALSYLGVKRGPYVVLPFIAQGNTRDVAGQILDMPLNPCSYIVGPVAAISSGLSKLNDMTTMQPLFKMADYYPDPYQVSKELYTIQKYIANENIDRIDAYKDTSDIQNVINISNTSSNVQPDVKLSHYNPQGPLVDAMRTIKFDNKNLNNSKWSELSVWNKSFPKMIKTSSVKIYPGRSKYKYRYILQPDKSAPVAVIYPSIGEGYISAESDIQAKLLFDSGYSVVIMGSSFNWEFIKSMPENYRPGLPYQDAYNLRYATELILNQLQGKYSCIFSKKILVGTSFGALTGIFTAEQDEAAKKAGQENIGFSKYVFICPPIQIFYALKQIDKYSTAWKNNPEEIKRRAALTTEKVQQVTYKVTKNIKEPEIMPFSTDEAGIAIGFAMKQKLSDVVFTIENAPTSKKSDIYQKINDMSFYDYANEYLISRQSLPLSQLDYNSSLYSVADFLENNNNYKIFHALDDCFVNQTQLNWLKSEAGNKATIFSNGSHLGFMYRKEFFDAFKKEIAN